MRTHIASRILGVVVTAVLAAGAMPSAALAAPGDQLWAAKYHAPGNHDDAGQAITTSPDGSVVFVTGDTADRRAYLTIAYDAATGSELWIQRWMGAAHANSGAASIAAGPMGRRVYVTGSLGTRRGDDFGTIAYDAATGAPVWQQRYDGPAGGDDQAWKVLVSPDGHAVYVTGSSEGPGGSAATTIAYDSKTGAPEWISRLRYRSHDTRAISLALSADGERLFATGSEGGGFATDDFYTVALDAATGSLLWSRRYDGPAGKADDGYDVAVTPDGGTVVVLGSSDAAKFNPDITTIAYDAADGSRRWVRRIDRGENDSPSALAISPSGATVAVAASVHPESRWLAVTTVYDVATGGTIWDRVYGQTSRWDGFATDVAFNPSGDALYVVGETERGEYSRYITLAYDAASGAELWDRHSADRGPFPRAEARAVVPAPDGSRVYVTGLRLSNAINEDVLTIAYQA